MDGNSIFQGQLPRREQRRRNREKYMNFSLNVLHNMIISYLLRLSDMKIVTIQEHLQALKKLPPLAS